MQKLKSKLQNILLIRRTNQPLPFCEGEIEREFSTRQSLSKGKIPLLFSPMSSKGHGAGSLRKGEG
jgi:hypothetical protein